MGFHVLIDPGQETLFRWAVNQGEQSVVHGFANEGTTIDYDEPFIITVRCDEDGWSLQSNDDEPYPHFLHIIPVNNITRLEVKGNLEVSFVGFGAENLEPAPPVGFNLTFQCPQGKVFSHDWLAIPFVMMTCRDNGLFDEPDWSQYECVLPTTTECFDCTTTRKRTALLDRKINIPIDV